jgi:hypothetical protein
MSEQMETEQWKKDIIDRQRGVSKDEKQKFFVAEDAPTPPDSPAEEPAVAPEVEPAPEPETPAVEGESEDPAVAQAKTLEPRDAC